MTGSHEAQLSPEAQAMLPEATAKIHALYMGEMMGRHLYKNLTPIQSVDREERWENAAQAYPPFTDTVRGFKQAFNRNQIERQRQAPGVILVLGYNFSSVEDMVTREFLTDVLMARVSGEHGLDSAILPDKQIDPMAAELGLADGFRGAQAKKLTLEDVIKGLLTEKLKLKAAETNPEIALDDETNIQFLSEIEIQNTQDTIRLYTDDRVKALTDTFDPGSYRGSAGSNYGEHGLEQQLSPLIALGGALDQYVGIDKRDVAKLSKWANGSSILGGRDDFPDVRIAKHQDVEILFPTTQLLENFLVQRRAPQE